MFCSVFVFQENCKKFQPTYVQSCKDNSSRGRELKYSKPYTGIVNIPVYLTWYSGDRLGGFQIIAGFQIRVSGLTCLLGLLSPDTLWHYALLWWVILCCCTSDADRTLCSLWSTFERETKQEPSNLLNYVIRGWKRKRVALSYAWRFT